MSDGERRERGRGVRAGILVTGTEVINGSITDRNGPWVSERLAELDAAGEPLVCSEIPLLFEKGLEAALRPVVVVSAPPSVQLQRALLRDGASAAELEARIAAQLPLADKVARADYVIDNQGSIDTLAAAADRTLTLVCKALGVALERYGLTDKDATD